MLPFQIIANTLHMNSTTEITFPAHMRPKVPETVIIKYSLSQISCMFRLPWDWDKHGGIFLKYLLPIGQEIYKYAEELELQPDPLSPALGCEHMTMLDLNGFQSRTIISNMPIDLNHSPELHSDARYELMPFYNINYDLTEQRICSPVLRFDLIKFKA